VTADTATRHPCSYDRLHAGLHAGYIAMERFLLLWDELDDLMGTSRYYVTNKAMAFWTTVRPR
jgi:hypothetical protein